MPGQNWTYQNPDLNDRFLTHQARLASLEADRHRAGTRLGAIEDVLESFERLDIPQQLASMTRQLDTALKRLSHVEAQLETLEAELEDHGP